MYLPIITFFVGMAVMFMLQKVTGKFTPAGSDDPKGSFNPNDKRTK